MVPIIVAIMGAIAVIAVPIIEEKLNRQELSTIRGTVTDTDGMQVAGAVIEIDGLSGTTDAGGGVYVIRDAPVGTRTVIVCDARRVEVLRRTLRITRGGETIIFDIVLQPPVTPTPTPMPTGILDVNPAAFVIQGWEFLLDTRYNPIAGLSIRMGLI